MKRLVEFIEKLFRAYRLSDHDIEVMSEKGYYFHLGKHKWVKQELSFACRPV